MSFLDRALRMGEAKKFKSYEQRVSRINAFEAELEHYSDEELRESADGLRERARNGESLDDLLYECFGLVREAGKRSMAMRHFDVQLIGGMVLHDGCIAEMKTGEGKTLTATLAVVLNSLAGMGVHVVTVNDYLARRDALWMKPIYDMLGVSVGVLQNMQPFEEKHAAYASDVTYGTNSEFGFDYLRDNMAKSLEEKFQHGGRGKAEDGKTRYHRFAIVDEVDNILIDEARTPLIISGAPEQAADLYAKFARLAPKLTAGKTPEGMDPRSKKDFVADFDYEFDEKHKTVSITEQGVAKAERFMGIDHFYRAENGHLVNHLMQSLRAESLYKRGYDYEVIDGEVKIIDEFTGRILEGRRWSEGLHQAVEAKEGVRVQEENQTLATITLQNYFRMYDKLAGMTGTALTEATEFMKIYELPVVQIPTNRPMVRSDRNDQVYKTKDGKWSAVVREIEARHNAGQPILVGTIAVEVSELLSEPADQARHQARGAQRQARARRPRGRDRRRGGRPGRGHDRHEHGRPRRRHQARRQRRASGDPRGGQARAAARRPRLRGALRSRSCRPSRSASRPSASRSWRPVACSSSAPSATSRGGSTTSCAAAPGARATRASPGSSSPPRTTSSACSPASGSTRSSTGWARSTTRATRSRSRPGCSPSRSRRPSARSRSSTSSSASTRWSTTMCSTSSARWSTTTATRSWRAATSAPPRARRSSTSSTGSSTSTPPASSSRTGTWTG